MSGTTSVAMALAQNKGPPGRSPAAKIAQPAKPTQPIASRLKPTRMRLTQPSPAPSSESSSSMLRDACFKSKMSSACDASLAALDSSRQNSTIVLPPVMSCILAAFPSAQMPCYQNLTQAR